MMTIRPFKYTDADYEAFAAIGSIFNLALSPSQPGSIFGKSWHSVRQRQN